MYLSDVPLEHKCQNNEDAIGFNSVTYYSKFSEVILYMKVFSVSPLIKKGCFPVKSMYIIIPNAHTSILLPYLCPYACSGAINKIVPVFSSIASYPEYTFILHSAERPKSAILAVYWV